MANQSDYFNQVGYKPKYFLGDRVTGTWNKIPFVGTVANDSVVSLDQGPQVSVMLDLPIIFDNTVRTVVVCKHSGVRKLPLFNLE